jgi:hypothetical protein
MEVFGPLWLIPLLHLIAPSLLLPQFGDSVFGAESGEHANLAEAGHPLGVAVERGKLVDIAFKAHISITGERLFTCQAKYSCASVEP